MYLELSGTIPGNITRYHTWKHYQELSGTIPGKKRPGYEAIFTPAPVQLMRPGVVQNMSCAVDDI